jgi:hypothetical protein
MARGWESKDVESQQDLLAAEVRERASPNPTPQQQETARRRAALDLDLIRIKRELISARHPRHRAQLEAALKHLQGEISGIEGNS